MLSYGNLTNLVQSVLHLSSLKLFSVMLGAGLLAKNAVEKGLRVPPYVKTSLSPGKWCLIALELMFLDQWPQFVCHSLSLFLKLLGC